MKIKLIATLLIIILGLHNINTFASAQLPYLIPQCPKEAELIKTTSKDKEELKNALKTIIPKVYPVEQSEIKIVQPLIKIKESPYFEMAKLRCNEEIANNSWYVQLLFPEYLPSASASTGIMFVTKTKTEGWKVWYQYK